MVVQLFGEVENKNVPIPEFPEHPFQEEQLRVSVERGLGCERVDFITSSEY